MSNTLEEIKNKIAQKHGYTSWNIMKDVLFCDDNIDLIDSRNDEASILYAEACSKASLEKASEESKIESNIFDNEMFYRISKGSIVNPDNIILL